MGVVFSLDFRGHIDVRSGSEYKMKSSNMLQKGSIVNMAITESMLFYLFARNYKS
jgi:hypothetical protein